MIQFHSCKAELKLFFLSIALPYTHSNSGLPHYTADFSTVSKVNNNTQIDLQILTVPMFLAQPSLVSVT